MADGGVGMTMGLRKVMTRPWEKGVDGSGTFDGRKYK